MECLGVKPGAAWWKAQTNPLSYGGTLIILTQPILNFKKIKIIAINRMNNSAKLFPTFFTFQRIQLANTMTLWKVIKLCKYRIETLLSNLHIKMNQYKCRIIYLLLVFVMMRDSLQISSPLQSLGFFPKSLFPGSPKNLQRYNNITIF